MDEMKSNSSNADNNEKTRDSNWRKRDAANENTESTAFSSWRSNRSANKVDNNFQSTADARQPKWSRQKENKGDSVKSQYYSYNKRSSQNQPIRERSSYNSKFQRSSSSKTTYFDFIGLNELSKKDKNEIMTVLAQKEEEFKELLGNSEKLIATPNHLVLTLEVLTKVCKADFTETVTSVLSNACSNSFLKSLETYITKLPFEGSIEKLKNNLYHDDKEKFWSNVNEFFKKLFQVLPTKARDELPFILQKFNIITDTIAMNQDYKINEQFKIDAEEMLEDCKAEIRKIEEKLKANKSKKSEFEEDPPEDFRTLSVVPTLQDLHQEKIFIRPCKIKDAYNSAEHYLDVQFRLLREDFMTPLRNGVQEYLRQSNKFHNNDLRIYKNVRIISPEITNNNVGVNVFFGKFNKVDWYRSKRFLYGSLLLLSDDNFRTVTFATVLDRNEDKLKEGFLSIEPCIGSVITEIMYKSNFVMLESKTFFEPYVAVLSALKRINKDNFPMERYLIYADTGIKMPKYLDGKGTLKLELRNRPIRQNTISLSLNDSSESDCWPSPETLGLDESQLNAFKCAMTQEFAVIQGPPGTGKTFIALEIVRTLLANKDYWNEFGPIVIVCLTNHALDQFLEGILKYTDSIVRMGRRSKNLALKRFTLAERRKNSFRHYSEAGELMDLKQRELENILSEMQKKRSFITCLTTPNVIVPMYVFKDMDETLVQYDQFMDNFNFLSWLIGYNINSLAEDLFSLEIRILEHSSNFEQDHVMDDELELKYKTATKYRCIRIIKRINLLIQKINRQLIEYRTSENNELPFNPLFEDILKHEEDLDLLKELRSFLQNELVCNPLLNQRGRQTNNPNWQLYWKWVKTCHEKVMNELPDLEQAYRQKQLEFNEAKQMVDLETLKVQKIVGLTTSGAARIQSSLSALHAPIVLVEEAAEILESHVVCSLTKDTQQVILIGDHKQLRPKASVYELGKRFNLNISLFERMVNVRGESDSQLTCQHRMRPQISKLIHPSIYDTLYNHHSVYKYPNVKGVDKNLFFINHNNREDVHDNDDSWFNIYEAEYLIKLTRYLLKQGYNPSEITILCTYTGQLFTLTREAERNAITKEVHITTIDNYQGEENKIILLSLVRNNGAGNIGFLREENRVCVALSRAREGLYIMGNMNDLLINNKIWPKINEVLETERAIGQALEVRCQIHIDQTALIKDMNDFSIKCPEGGCLKTCGADLSCGHSCASVCHILNRQHEHYKCQEKCNKNCKNGHPCQLQCYESCEECLEKIERELKCGHTVQILCLNDDDKFRCYVKVNVTLSACNHRIEKSCSTPIEKCKCTYPCDSRLPCGHQCDFKCHVDDDPDHIYYKCVKNCIKTYPNCEHPCQNKCHEECGLCPVIVEKKRSCGHHYKEIQCSQNVEDIKCKRPCKRNIESCGHKCPSTCSEICGNCQEKVKKLSACGHELEVKCCEEPNPSKCNYKCIKILECGHPCTKKCKEPCIKICKNMEELSKPGICGHVFKAPCYTIKNESNFSELLKYCKEPCNVQLSCGHFCSGTCGQCKQGRFHVPCSKPCNKILICGHKCKLPCRRVCEPCSEPCECKCRHTKCNKKCSTPCTSCKRPCTRGCEHRKCKKQCYELCDVDPCNEACKKKLKCGHLCVGYCGDPCPPLCRICNHQALIEGSCLGYENQPDARFIFLEDCHHCIESKALENWLMQSSGSVGMKMCPLCKTPILKCMRITNTIKANLKDILTVKNRVFFNNQNELKKQKDKCLENLKFLQNNLILTEFPEFKDFLLILQIEKGIYEDRGKKKKRFLNVQEIEAFKILLNIVQQLLDITNGKLSVDYDKFVKQLMRIIVDMIPIKMQMTNQQIDDIQLELRRLRYLVEVCKLDAEQNDKEVLPADKNTYETLITKLLSFERFDEKFEKEIQIAFDEVLKIDFNIQSQVIVKPLGYTYGLWYKCSNGHCFAVNNCKDNETKDIRCNKCDVTV